MRGSLGVVGILFVVAGAAVLVSPVFGFETIAADRTAEVETAEDPEALLGIEDVYDDTEVQNTGGPSDDDAEVLDLTNRFGEDINTVDAEVTSIDGVDNNVLEVGNLGDLFDGIEDGNTKEVILSCSGDVAGSGTEDVTITILQATGDSIELVDKPVTVNVTFDCEEEDDDDGSDPAPDPTPIEDTDLRLTNAGVAANDDGIVVFTITNDGEAVTVTEVEIRSTSLDDDVVEVTQGGPEIIFGAGEHDEGGQNDGISPGDGPRTIEPEETIETDQSADSILEQFVDSDGTGNQAGVDMSGEDVTIVLYFAEEDDLDAVEMVLEDLEEE